MSRIYVSRPWTTGERNVLDEKTGKLSCRTELATEANIATCENAARGTSPRPSQLSFMTRSNAFRVRLLHSVVQDSRESRATLTDAVRAVLSDKLFPRF